MGIESTTKPLPAAKAAVRPRASGEEHPVRWPSVATSGGAAYLSHPEPQDEAAPKTGTEG